MEAKMPHENHSNHLFYLVNIKINFPGLKKLPKTLSSYVKIVPEWP